MANNFENSSSFFKNFFDYTSPDKEKLLNAQGATEESRALADFLNTLCGNPSQNKGEDNLSRFFKTGIRLIQNEIDSLPPEKRTIIEKSGEYFPPKDRKLTEETLWKTFFPEALIAMEPENQKNKVQDRGKTTNELKQRIERLRAKRVIEIESLNPRPINSVSEEMIFTSNVLITLPSSDYPYKGLGFSDHLKEKLRSIKREDQSYWFDHPILLGTPPEGNELLYGLKGLSETLAFEKGKGTVSDDARLTVILSVSVTHRGLKEIAREYITDEIKKSSGIEGLDLYVFTEDDTESLAAALMTGENAEPEQVKKVFGVDGEYGRHYSFLKAVAALWHVAVDTKIRGTFKIDLDQVFPGKELVNETGKSAFEHFQSPLWGALGTDSEGKKIELGMIAGALVNESDISRSIFTPDVPFADIPPEGEDLFFNKRFVMAFSTEAELMTRYNSPQNGSKNHIDGKSRALSRIHVTGGTNGILVNALRKYRPFTPTFIGRAEDQSFILSVIFKESEKTFLRYVHEDGLIMRHDKEAFAGEAIKAAKLGSYTGDLLRTLLFTHYAAVLTDNQIEKIKTEIDPFTGCFVTTIPYTNIFLRMSLRALDLYRNNRTEADLLVRMAAERLLPIIERFSESNFLKDQYETEKRGWDLFYNALENLENGLKKSDSSSLKKRDALRTLTESCRVSID